MPIDRVEVRLQRAGEEDIPEMAALWAEAFPEKPAERRDRELREGLTYGDLTDCWIVRDQGRIAGALRTYRLTMHLHGRPLPTMGLAGVAVAPDFRRRGIGRQMCVEALRIARARGDVLSALFPFRTSFYRDLGYVLAGEYHRYRFDARDLPAYPGWDRVVRAPDRGREIVREVYDRVAPNTNGFLERSSPMWGFLDREGIHLYLHRSPRGRPTGYVVVRGRGGPPERSRLRVLELVAEDREAYLGLLGWLAVQRDQWGRIVYDALPGEDFHQRLPHPRTEGSGNPRGLWFHSAAILRGPMLRILDLGAVLAPGSEAGPLPGEGGARGEILRVRDTVLEENQGGWLNGERRSAELADSSGGVLSIGEVTSAFVRGTLAGAPRPPSDWRPNLGLSDVRILDEF